MTSILTRRDSHVGVGLYDSIQWAFDVHVKTKDTGEYQFAILHGNEDSPTAIDFYTESDPLETDCPAYRWTEPKGE